jgi:hypothetical protein
MRITLTFADAIVELFLGLLLFFITTTVLPGLPRALSYSLTWWAHRSKKSAAKRCDRLRRELQKIEELRKDLSRYIGLLIRFALTSLFLLAFGPFLFLLYLGLKVSIVQMYVSGIGITGNVSSHDTMAPIVEICGGIFLFLFAFLLLGAFHFFGRAREYWDLANYERCIVDQIAKLHGRWGV